MAKRFLRVDLSAETRDFQTVAVEPGLALLDKSNTNYRVLQRWLGRLIAMPEWHGESVDLFVCDDQQARLNDVHCESATAEDFARSRELRQDLEELAKRLKLIRPEPKEVKLHESLLRHFQKVTAESGPTHKECYFFKYRDGAVWRLVWAWGYQRQDLAPSPPCICTNPNCSLLFVRGTDGKRSCPACEKTGAGAAVAGGGRGRSTLRRTALVAVVAAILGAAAVYLWDSFHKGKPHDPTGQPIFAVSPTDWAGPVGGRLQYRAVSRESHAEQEEEVSGRVQAVAEDPRVLRLDGLTARALASGKTPVHFYYGDKVAHATVEIKPPTNPLEISLDPPDSKLGINTTAQVRVWGKFDDDVKVDLIDGVEWTATPEGIVYCQRGRLEGVNAGQATLNVRYRATPDAKYLTATAKVTVLDEEFKRLELTITPSVFRQGEVAKVAAQVVLADGQTRSVWASSPLTLEAVPGELVKIEDDGLRAVRPGKGELKAKYRDFEVSQAFEVTPPGPRPAWQLVPKELHLVCGEMAELQVVSASREPCQVLSSDPGIVELRSGLQIAGRTPGKAVVTVSQEANQGQVTVEVSLPEVKSVHFVPDRISVPVDGEFTLRLVGVDSQGKEADLNPEGVTWLKLPSFTFADLDQKTMQVRGRLPTGDTPQQVEARWGELRAKARIDVGLPPCRIELTPPGPVRLAVGQAAQLQVWAQYAQGRRVEITPERLQWNVSPTKSDGLELEQSVAKVRATKPGMGPLSVTAVFGGARSNAVEFRSGEPLQFTLQPDHTPIHAGETGQFRAVTESSTTPDVALEGVEFISSDPKVLSIDRGTGAYRALKAGQVQVAAQQAQSKVRKKSEILEILPAKELPKPTAVRIVGTPPIVIPVRASFGDFRVEAAFSNGPVQNVTGQATLSYECDDPKLPPVSIQDGQITGQRLGKALIQAEYQGIKSTQGLPVEVGDPELTEIKIVPDTVALVVNREDLRTTGLRAEGFTGRGADRRALGDITARPGLAWTTNAPEIVQVTGPQVTALSSGEALVTAKAGGVSAQAKVTSNKTDGLTQGFGILHPDELHLRVGETKWIGKDITYSERGLNLSDKLEVESSAPGIVRYHRENRSVEGVLAGTANLLVNTGTGIMRLPVIVEGNSPPSAGRVVIEPNSGTLGVGQPLDLRVILITDPGDRIDQTSSAVVQSDSAERLAVSGTRIQGVTPGTSQVTAKLPGLEEPGRATFTIEADPLTKLEVSPPALKLAQGDTASLRITGIGSRGRRELSAHPQLKLDVVGENPSAIEVRGPDSIRGVALGKATIRVGWSDSAAPPVEVPVEICDCPSQDLVLEPKEATVEQGTKMGFAVTTRRGDRTVMLAAADGVELRTADSGIAEPGEGLTVTGISAGTTEVTAFLGPRRAAARLTVVPRATKPPDEPIIGLRFLPDVLTLQLGVPGAPVRLVRGTAAGSPEDVLSQAEIDIADTSVAKLKQTAEGKIFEAEKVGQTEATAKCKGLTTRRPLQIVVVDPPARLDVRPDPLPLRVGDTDQFRRVQIVPLGGGTPTDVDYRVTSKDPRIVRVEGDKQLHAVAPGETIVTVAPVLPGGRFANATADVTVQVTQPGGEAQLVLTGPSRTTKDAEVDFRVELEDGSGRRDVTQNGAQLVVDQDQEPLIERRPGCRLRAVQPGTVNVRARYGDRNSNAVLLRIDDGLAPLQRLELEIDRQALVPDENRSYKLWGYPVGGGSRQDLTSLVNIQGLPDSQANLPQITVQALEPADATDLVTHTPPTLVAKKPGRFSVSGSCGGRRSETVELDILPDIGEFELSTVPTAVAVRTGESTSQLYAVARSIRGPGTRKVDAQWSSDNPAILVSDPEQPGVFQGAQPGKTRLKATFRGKEAFVAGTVIDDPFHQVKLRDEPDWQPRNRFAVIIEITGPGQGPAGLEYRVSPAGDSNLGKWEAPAIGKAPVVVQIVKEPETVPAPDAGVTSVPRWKIELKSPSLERGAPETVYNLLIEARDKSEKSVARYPLMFMIGGPKVIVQPTPTKELPGKTR
ncbi:MAG: hypothetical protein NTY19_05955 [Planctomycetota bacterium]|nr:hypothetical protein [Planctomycetota bacterium]